MIYANIQRNRPGSRSGIGRDRYGRSCRDTRYRSGSTYIIYVSFNCILRWIQRIARSKRCVRRFISNIFRGESEGILFSV